MTWANAGIIAALIAALAALLGVFVSRRTAAESNEIQQELSDATILHNVVESLQGEVDRLKDSLDDANDRAQLLNERLEIAYDNIRILSLFIREKVPEEPFPRLKRMTSNGR